MSNEAKFIPIDTKVGQFLSEGYYDHLPEWTLFPVFEEEYDAIGGFEFLGLLFEELESVEPEGWQVGYCYGEGKYCLMTKDEFYKEYNTYCK